MSQRAADFIRDNELPSPCLVIDVDAVKTNYSSFREHLAETEVFYAVKANPQPEVLKALADLGSSFDCASVAEIRMALAAGATPERISFGNTIKKERDIAEAYALGVRLFAVDAFEEVCKLERAAPDARVFCRILSEGAGAEWPLSRKFGCDPKMAVQLLFLAAELGLEAYGVSFHVGSQMTCVNGWDEAVGQAKFVFDRLRRNGIHLKLVNLGGGFPTRYLRDIPAMQSYADGIRAAMHKHFGDEMPRMIIEPGRGMVGNAGVIKSEVVLVSTKSDEDRHRWVFLDIGKFGGLAETMDEAIRYRMTTQHDADRMGPCVVAGPTCDSADVLYETRMYPLPETLAAGDEVLIHDTGAYTTTYSAVAFNGFAPLKAIVI